MFALGVVVLIILIATGLLLLVPSNLVWSNLSKFLTSKMFKTYECERIMISPFRIVNFELRTFASGSMPEVGVSWRLFEVRTYFYEWIQFNFTNKLVVFRLDDVNVDIPILSFADILDPPENAKKSGGPLSVLHQMALWFQVEITTFSINMKFPDIRSEVDLSATYMLLNFELTVSDSQALVAAVTFENGHVLVLVDGEESVEYSGHEAHINVAVNMPTRTMKVDINLLGKDVTTVQNQRFLEFFGHFNTADDNSIEMKLAQGLPTGGKMCLIRVHMDEMIVFLSDRRSTVSMVMAMEGVLVQLATVRLEGEDAEAGGPTLTSPKNEVHDEDEYSIGDWVDEAEGYSFEKTITVKMRSLHFVGQKGCSVSGVSVIIKKTAINSRDFIDCKNMEVEVQEAIFPWIDNLFLEWLLIAHQMSDAIPDSRFQHATSAVMTAKINVVQITLSPVDFGRDKSVRFTFDELTVAKTQAPREVVSHFTMAFDSLDIVTTRPYSSLQERFSVDFSEEQRTTLEDCTLSVLYKAVGVTATFSLGGDFQLHDVDLQDLHIVEDTHVQSSVIHLAPRIIPLFRISTLHIDGDPHGLTVTMEKMTGTIGVASVLKCLITYEMIMCVQERVTGKMDLIEVAVAPLTTFPTADGEIHAVDIAPSETEYVPPGYSCRAMSITSASSVGGQSKSIVGSVVENELYQQVDEHGEVLKTNTFKWSLIEITLCLDVPASTSNRAQSSIYMGINLKDMLFSTHGESDRIEFGACNVFANGADQYEFLSIRVFSMNNGRKKATHRQRTGDSRVFTQVTNLIKCTDINVEDLAIRFHPDMKLGGTIDAAMKQKEAMMNAMQNPSVAVDDTKTASLLLVRMGRFSFVVDALHYDSVHNTFATVAFCNIDLAIEDYLSEEETIHKIAEMDTNAFTPMNYTGVSGGYVKGSWSDFSIDLHMMSRRYFFTNSVAIDGYLYSAAAEDSRIAVNHNAIVLSDPSYLGKREPRAATPAYVGLTGLMKDSQAPSKIYSCSAWKFGDLELFMDVDTDALMADWLAEIDRCLPPNTDPSPPLQWWDNVRFWCHGQCTMIIDTFVASTSRLSELKAPVKLNISLRDLYMNLDRFLFELKGYNLDVSVEYEEAVRSKRRKQMRTMHRVTARNLKHKQSWCLCHMPMVAISLAHAPCSLDMSSYDHHDVYCRPANASLGDRFAHFRMGRKCSLWGVHITCSDSATQCIAIYLRLDVLQRVKSAFSGPAAESPASPSASAPPHGDLMMDLTECISSLDVHVSLDDFIACSWASAISLNGVIFSQDNMRLDLKLQQAPLDLMNLQAKASSESSGLELESIYAEIEHVDVYVREWGIDRTSGGVEECRDVADVTSLFASIYKLAHATKVTLKYEDEAPLAEHIPGFVGKSELKSHVPNFKTAVEQKGYQYSCLPSQSTKVSILSFRANHALFAPPVRCSHVSFAQRRRSSHALDLLSMSRDRPPLSKEPNSRHCSDENCKYPKIWDVKVVDIRLLWTIELRNNLSAFAARCSEIFSSQQVMQEGASQSDNQVTTVKAVPSGHMNRSASMDDSLLGRNPLSAISETGDTEESDDVLMVLSPPRKGSGRMTEKATIKDFLDHSTSFRDHGGILDADSTRLMNHNPQSRTALQKRQSGGLDLVSHYLSSPSADTSRLPNCSTTHSSPPNPSSTKKLRRGKTRRMSIKHMNMALDDMEAPFDEVDSDINNPQNESAAVIGVGGIYGSRRLTERSTSVDNSILNCTPEKEEKDEWRSRSKHHFEKFFSVELQDPQVNFLDESTQSSLVIVVSGASTLVGKRHLAATVTVQGLGEIEEPKKKVNVILRMDGVSAFTVSTASEESYNTVHWKALDRTEIIHQGDRRHSKTEKGFKASFDSSTRRLSSSRRTMYSEHVDTISSSLQKAIDNFQIIAKYTYYEDITVVEASKMHIHRTREELMSTFMLDLPELCMKIDAGQFYIFINAIRNVLLAPPPVQGDKQSDEDIENADKKAGIVRLHSQGVRPSIDSRTGRNEIRSIVEQNLSSLPEGELCMAQSVEYFIGRGTWLLCADSSPNEVLLEVGFMGLLGTHSFHEDRSSSSVFEVQRLWVRDIMGNKVSAGSKRASRPNEGAVEGADGEKTEWALMPVLTKEDACTRCKAKFNVKNNSSDSCRCHVDSEGVDGKFKEMVVFDTVTNTRMVHKCWTCCLNPLEDAPGCFVRPHICKELMLAIRAESCPPAAVDDLDLTIFQTLEISVFPGAAYTIEVQISSQVTDMLHQYFAFSEQVMVEEDDLLDNTKDPSVREQSDIDINDPDDSSGPLNPVGGRSDSIASMDSVMSVSSTRTVKFRASRPVSMDDEAAKEAAMVSKVKPKQEALYIKYLRVGDIVLEVSTFGYAVPLTKVPVVVNEFSIRNKVMDWHRLIWKFEMHAILCVSSHTATKSMNRLWEMVFGKQGGEENSEGNAHSDETKKLLLLGM